MNEVFAECEEGRELMDTDAPPATQMGEIAAQTIRMEQDAWGKRITRVNGLEPRAMGIVRQIIESQTGPPSRVRIEHADQMGFVFGPFLAEAANRQGTVDIGPHRFRVRRVMHKKWAPDHKHGNINALRETLARHRAEGTALDLLMTLETLQAVKDTEYLIELRTLIELHRDLINNAMGWEKIVTDRIMRLDAQKAEQPDEVAYWTWHELDHAEHQTARTQAGLSM